MVLVPVVAGVGSLRNRPAAQAVPANRRRGLERGVGVLDLVETQRRSVELAPRFLGIWPNVLDNRPADGSRSGDRGPEVVLAVVGQAPDVLHLDGERRRHALEVRQVVGPEHVDVVIRGHEEVRPELHHLGNRQGDLRAGDGRGVRRVVVDEVGGVGEGVGRRQREPGDHRDGVGVGGLPGVLADGCDVPHVVVCGVPAAAERPVAANAGRRRVHRRARAAGVAQHLGHGPVGVEHQRLPDPRARHAGGAGGDFGRVGVVVAGDAGGGSDHAHALDARPRARPGCVEQLADLVAGREVVPLIAAFTGPCVAHGFWRADKPVLLGQRRGICDAQSRKLEPNSWHGGHS